MNVEIRIRPACDGDLPALQALKTRAASANTDDREFLDSHSEALQLAPACLPGLHVASLEDGAPIGFIGIEDHEDGKREITELFVDPNHWRLGIGRSLLRFAHSKSGNRKLFAIANPTAKAFYSACGFSETGTASVETGTAPVFSSSPELVEPAQ